MLITPEALREHLRDPTWVIFDCRHDLFDPARGRELYRESHLPGAFFAPLDEELSGPKTGRNGRHPLPDPRRLADFLARHGVTPEVQIVAYDDVGGQFASRLWWLARWIGLTRVGVLDGGWARWRELGHPTDAAPPAPRAPGRVTPRPNPAAIATAEDVLKAVQRNAGIVIDARAPERFRGEVEPIDPVAGHIPTAQNRFFKVNLAADLTLRPPGELREEFAALLGAHPPAAAIHQCGSGVTACVNLFAMEQAGLRGSRLYVGSWSEWIADPSRPISRVTA